jgi:hypothetical protein
MWDYYKRTFLMVQIAALTVSYLVYSATNHALVSPIVFFLTMQVSSVLGAMWANRLRRKVEATDRA